VNGLLEIGTAAWLRSAFIGARSARRVKRRANPLAGAVITPRGAPYRCTFTMTAPPALISLPGIGPSACSQASLRLNRDQDESAKAVALAQGTPASSGEQSLQHV
jgi:hypothetical protein